MILIVTEPFDPHADFVEDELRRRGLPFERLHLSDLPQRCAISYSLDDTDALLGSIRRGDQMVPLDSISAVWYRRTARFDLPSTLNLHLRRFSRAECAQLVNGLWSILQDARWLVDPALARLASNKPEQLLRAQRHGFSVPRSCFGNDPSAIRRFLDSVWARGGQVVYKPFTPLFVQPDTGAAPSVSDETIGVVYTSLVDRDIADRLDEIRFAPGCFQERVPKDCDIRVTVVGHRVFACEIHSQLHPMTAVDSRAYSWTCADDAAPIHEPVQLPEAIEDMCVSMARDYGINYAAIDLVRTPEGDHVFLELNPNGQWVWIEELTGLPIRSAIVDFLAGSDALMASESESSR
jgi:hypothetical protein